jgi:hypothetical protein
MEHPEIGSLWFGQSNYLGWLSVANEQELCQLIDKARQLEITVSVFREPDIDNQITAIALAPGARSKKLCGELTLALKE